MAPFGISPKLWWPNMGHVAQVPEEIELLRGFVTSGVPPVQTACQVGHNAGHSAAAWLDGLDGVTLVSFDLFSLPYSNASKSFFRANYPGRVVFYSGRERARRCSFSRTRFHCSSRTQRILADLPSLLGCSRLTEPDPALRLPCCSTPRHTPAVRRLVDRRRPRARSSPGYARRVDSLA
eukprot:5229567-Prymnesium_polylepis.1